MVALERLVRTADIDATKHITDISAVLTTAARRLDFPSSQVPRWVWVASQFRLHIQEKDEVAARAGASLYFLIRKLASKVLQSEDIQDLNWILDSTIRHVRQLVPAQDFRRYLSDREVKLIDERLQAHAQTADFDSEHLRKTVAARLELIRSFGAMTDLADLAAKVDALFRASVSPSGEYQAARAALRYLAEEEDVVSDGLGFLGLLDDIYVLEWAYAAVETQTRCLPILDGLVRRFPFVGELPLLKDGRVPLNRFGQYAACVGLQVLFEGAQPAVAVLRELGPYPLITGIMAAVECARRQVTEFEGEISLWRKGDPLLISDGVETFKVTFQGTEQLRGTKYKIGVKDSGTILIDEKTLPYVVKASKAHGTLSSGTAIAKWQKDRHIDPLVNITGVGRRLSSQHEAVLLVVPKHKLDNLLGSLRPFGLSARSLLGVKYLTTHDELADAATSFTDRPFIYACSDPAVAVDLLREPPAHISRWNVVIDGSRLGRSICSSLAAVSSVGGPRFCIFAELFDREATTDILNLGVDRIWYLEDQDVEVPLERAETPQADDIVSQMIERRSAHWSSTREVHAWKDDFLESVAQYLRESDKAVGRAAECQWLDISVANFLHKAMAHPLPSLEQAEELRKDAGAIVGQASVLRQFDALATGAFEIFKSFAGGQASINQKTDALQQLTKPRATDERIAVVCRSGRIADECADAMAAHSSASNISWTNIETLRRSRRFDRIVVPGWIDRLTMRELAFNGYANRTDFLLTAYERRWFDATTNAISRWERHIEGKTAGLLASTAIMLDETGDLSARWQAQTALRVEATPQSELIYTHRDSDDIDADELDANAIEVISRTLSGSRAGSPIGRAQVVLFEAPGAYALLPPGGEVIVLSEVAEAVGGQSAGKPERVLSRNVAELKNGMVLAFSMGDDRDLIDATADQLLNDGGSLRRSSRAWKEALRRATGLEDARIVEICRKMADAGHPRDPSTVRFWMTHDQTVAPRNYRSMIQVIADITDDKVLRTNIRATLQAIERVYQARATAAKRIVEQVFAGDIDINQPSVKVMIGKTELAFALHKVRRIGEIRSVPVELIGTLGSFDRPPSVAT